MQETMMPTYVVCWWSLRQDGNSVERWNRMELRMMVALYACWRAGHLSALAVRQAKNSELPEYPVPGIRSTFGTGSELLNTL